MNGIADALNALAVNGGSAEELLQAIHGQVALGLGGTATLNEDQVQSIRWHLGRNILTGIRAEVFEARVFNMTDDKVGTALSRIRATGDRAQWQEIENWARTELTPA
ncbi:MAG: hypothetical protein Q8N65_02695 [bacterium]|nr:hypothetical protein [bacterium]